MCFKMLTLNYLHGALYVLIFKCTMGTLMASCTVCLGIEWKGYAHSAFIWTLFLTMDRWILAPISPLTVSLPPSFLLFFHHVTASICMKATSTNGVTEKNGRPSSDTCRIGGLVCQSVHTTQDGRVQVCLCNIVWCCWHVGFLCVCVS